MKKNEFDASPSALGYIYQVRYALYASLKKIQELDDPDVYSVVIEKVDDISFNLNDSPKELLQTKHKTPSKNLTDKSSDFWGTIRIWAELSLKGDIDLSSISLFLITTQPAGKKSLAKFLSNDSKDRDVAEALKIVDQICTQKVGKEIEKGVEAFKLLSKAQKLLLLNRVEIITNSEDIIEIGKSLKKILKLYTTKEHLPAFIERLEGYWFNEAIECMKGNIESISLSGLIGFFDDLRNQFSSQNLPNDFSDTALNEICLDDEDKYFLQQIKTFTNNSQIIDIAKENYYRTYAQVFRWQSDGLLKPNEMTKYRRKIEKEWANINSLISFDTDSSCEQSKLLHAKNVYKRCLLDSVIPIRPLFDEPYVCRGTYHYLSDTLKIGWHPDYLSLLSPSNDEDVA